MTLAPLAHGDSAARAAVDATVRSAERRLGDRLEAAFAIGSLAHGGFSAAVSDVDVALVVADSVAAADIAAVAADVDHPRLSVFWDTWENLAANREGGRFPAIDRADLLDSGALLRGTDRRAGGVRPSTTDLARGSAEFVLAKFDNDAYVRVIRDPAALIAQGRRPVTKAVMFPVRMLYTLATSRVDGNAPAVQWFVDTAGGRDAELVTAAGRLREDEGMPAALAELLGASLPGLYRKAADALAEALPADPERRLREGLARFADTVGG